MGCCGARNVEVKEKTKSKETNKEPEVIEPTKVETRDILLGDISDNARAIYGKSAEINKSYFNQKDNCLKWNTISNIDEDFIQRYLNNGNVIFYLPNKFEYIIEKIFKNYLY